MDMKLQNTQMFYVNIDLDLYQGNSVGFYMIYIGQKNSNKILVSKSSN